MGPIRTAADGKDVICEKAAHSFSSFSWSLIFLGRWSRAALALSCKNPSAHVCAGNGLMSLSTYDGPESVVVKVKLLRSSGELMTGFGVF